MDRRQRKSREAIFNAFVNLLSKKSFDNITVGEIIEQADVGRATFYAHFETKEFLLKGLCAELFDHIFESELKNNTHRNIFQCDAPNSVFLHLFQHFKKNDNNICKLLSSENNGLFLKYFNDSLIKLIKNHLHEFQNQKPDIVSEDFWISYVTSTFVNTVLWWVEKDMQLSPETITNYFLAVV